jgi:hypothetical protein
MLTLTFLRLQAQTEELLLLQPRKPSDEEGVLVSVYFFIFVNLVHLLFVITLICVQNANNIIRIVLDHMQTWWRLAFLRARATATDESTVTFALDFCNFVYMITLVVALLSLIDEVR